MRVTQQLPPAPTFLQLDCKRLLYHGNRGPPTAGCYLPHTVVKIITVLKGMLSVWVKPSDTHGAEMHGASSFAVGVWGLSWARLSRTALQEDSWVFTQLLISKYSVRKPVLGSLDIYFDCSSAVFSCPAINYMASLPLGILLGSGAF